MDNVVVALVNWLELKTEKGKTNKKFNEITSIACGKNAIAFTGWYDARLITGWLDFCLNNGDSITHYILSPLPVLRNRMENEK